MLNFLLEEAANTGGSPLITIGMLLLVVVGFYFLLIRPETKREKQAQAMRSALQVGDEVTTIGGIIGKVVSIKDETFVLETTKERTHIRFLVSAIRSVDVKAEESVRPRTTAPAQKAAPKKEDTKKEAPAEETPAEAPVEAPVEAPAEETFAPAAEEPVAEAAAEEAAES